MDRYQYDTIRVLVSVPTFLAVWAVLITAVGPVYGILLCWIPAMIAGWLVGWLWPVIAIGAGGAVLMILANLL